MHAFLCLRAAKDTELPNNAVSQTRSRKKNEAFSTEAMNAKQPGEIVICVFFLGDLRLYFMGDLRLYFLGYLRLFFGWLYGTYYGFSLINGSSASFFGLSASFLWRLYGTY